MLLASRRRVGGIGLANSVAFGRAWAAHPTRSFDTSAFAPTTAMLTGKSRKSGGCVRSAGPDTHRQTQFRGQFTIALTPGMRRQDPGLSGGISTIG